jgi:Zn-dependent protease
LGKSVRIGKIFGIPIRVDFSWLIGFILFAVMLSTTSLPGAYPNWDTAYYWIVGVTTIILLFGSVLIHELAHSIVSRKTGIAVKNITLFIFGGIAQIDKEAAQPKIERYRIFMQRLECISIRPDKLPVLCEFSPGCV